MVRVGVLALQGSFREHITALKACGADALEVRTKEELHACDGLIIPGGESTTMAHIAVKTGMLDELRKFVIEQKRPVWGTCAGLIFLAETAEGAKQGGQVLLQCLKVHVSRNFFGAQIASFEQRLNAHQDLAAFGGDNTFRAVFIRAPAILSADPSVTVLAKYELSPEEKQRSGRSSVIVAAECNNMMATAFHPELTDDIRWHKLFVDRVQKAVGGQSASEYASREYQMRQPNIPADLPVFGTVHPCA